MTFVLEKLQILNIIGNAIGLSKNGDKYILLVWPATQQKILILMIDWHKIEGLEECAFDWLLVLFPFLFYEFGSIEFFNSFSSFKKYRLLVNSHVKS